MESVRLGLENVEDLRFLRETIRISFGENELSIHLDLKNPTATSDEFGGDIEFLLYGSFQTGSPGKEVSNPAVFDLEMHPCSFPGFCRCLGCRMGPTGVGCASCFLRYKSHPPHCAIPVRELRLTPTRLRVSLAWSPVRPPGGPVVSGNNHTFPQVWIQRRSADR